MGTKSDKAIVLLSGGQYSATALLFAISSGLDVRAVTIDFGVRPKEPVKFSMEFCRELSVTHTVLNARGLLRPGDTGTRETLPGRMEIVMAAGMNMASHEGTDKIITGHNQGHGFSGAQCFDDQYTRHWHEKIKVVTPLEKLTNEQIWYLSKTSGDQIGVDGVDLITRFTFSGETQDKHFHIWGIGNSRDPENRERKKGFEEAKKNRWI